MSLSILILVTHLQGVGHLARAAAIGRGLARAGHRTTLVSGGLPVATIRLDGLEVVQLPPARVEGNDFRRLLDASGMAVSGAWRRERAGRLVATLAETRPDVIVTELYPFGRRQLAAEFDALLERAQGLSPAPRIVASVRDVLVPPSSPGKAREAAERIERFYDAVLVHGDPAFLSFEESWPVTPALARKLVYTGYVAEPEAVAALPDEGPGAGEIVVSAGGGATGRPLFEAALATAALWPDGPPWRILVGTRLEAAERDAFLARAGGRAAIEPARADFPLLLARCAASVSRGGYNTVVETLAARARAVIIPFEDGRESEQRQRAEKLAQLGLGALLREADLTPAALLSALRSALARPRSGPAPFSLTGVDRTVKALAALARGEQPRRM